ncbi:transmembrane protein, putative, partial [Rhizoctonia solani AG-3 Rhs1AP]
MRSTTELTEPLNSQQPGASLGSYETRQRTNLVVEGFSGLALLAILFSGVQAQFISTTSSDNSNAAARATNAVLFGGLILSVCSALLATLSGRWFSILREDDSEFLSSHWLAAESRQKNTPILEYLKFQREDWLNKLPFQLQQQHYSQPLSPNGSKGDGISMWQNKMTGSPTQGSEMAEMEAGRSYGHMHGPTPTPRERDVQFVISLIDEEMRGDTTIREKIVSKDITLCCGYLLLCICALCSRDHATRLEHTTV